MTHAKSDNMDLMLGDCLEVMAEMPENSVDAIVTDPPYGLSFMGQNWDHGVPGEAFWREAIRVAKPGCHLLAFGGTRMVHRLAVAIEDAGWEIRDRIHWVYGSGFPKSHDVSKAIDKAAGAEREVVGEKITGKARTDDGWNGGQQMVPVTAPKTDAARQWQGWGTALKPAVEPIILARKPFKGTVAANVQKWGTGAINVDGCRVGGEPWKPHLATGLARDKFFTKGPAAEVYKEPHSLGRWPANLIHDGSEEVVGLFPKTTSGKIKPHHIRSAAGGNGTTHGAMDGVLGESYGDSGSAARFFYCPKASKADRGEGNSHPTVKPHDLMRYLCRLITPPGGVVLDPFMGSGSTGKAAQAEGFRFMGIEKEPEYLDIACARLGTGPLFSGDTQ